MGFGAAVRSFQARICSSATKDGPCVHVSTKCVLALTVFLVILSGKRGSWVFFFFFKDPSAPALSIQKQMVAPLNDFVREIDCQTIFKHGLMMTRFLFVLRFYGPVNPMGSCRARSVYLTTRLLGRLCPLSG